MTTSRIEMTATHSALLRQMPDCTFNRHSMRVIPDMADTVGLLSDRKRSEKVTLPVANHFSVVPFDAISGCDNNVPSIGVLPPRRNSEVKTQNVLISLLEEKNRRNSKMRMQF